MILLIDNYDSFTWNLVQRLGELDPSLTLERDLLVVRNDKLDPAEAASIDGGKGPSRILISPGPCTPDEAGSSMDFIEAFAGKIPILGVCLGHQCIAARHGMRVRQHPPMHGKVSAINHDGKGIFEGVPDPMDATRYHSLVVPVEDIPELVPGEDGWEVSAWNSDHGTKVVQGLRRVWAEPNWPDGTAKAPMDGVQFHPESFLTEHGPRILANFLGLPAEAADRVIAAAAVPSAD